MAKVTGIGGVFIKARGDNKELAAWYQRCLGFELEAFGGAILNWQQDAAEDKGVTVWCVAEKQSKWFQPGNNPFMINYRVDDMDGMIARLNAQGVDIVQGPESHENGEFLWVLDPDGNKVELWQPKIWEEINKE